MARILRLTRHSASDAQLDELRRIYGEDLEIETVSGGEGELEKALQTFKGLSNIHKAENPGSLSVSLDDRERIPNLVAHLVGEGVPIFNLMRQEPTLEDVYFALNTETESEA